MKTKTMSAKNRKQETDEEAGATRPELQIVTLADVRAEPLEWLWSERIPRGKLTILDGDPALGKSTLTLDIAARVSAGGPLPGAELDHEPAHVLLVCVEDGVEDTIVPRLEAAGADLKMVHTLREQITLPNDVERLKRAVEQTQATLVILDPIMAMLGRPASNDQAVRDALQPVVNMAAETGAAVLAVRHLNKGGGKNVLYRGGGSIGIIGLARSGLLVARDPDDPHQRVLATYKSNLATRPPSMRFGFLSTPSGYAKIAWQGSSNYDGERLLATAGDPEKRTALEEATEFLRGLLQEGPVVVPEVKKLGAAAGHSWATLRRAQTRLSVETKKTGYGQGAPWAWSLPAVHGTDGGTTSGDRADVGGSPLVTTAPDDSNKTEPSPAGAIDQSEDRVA